MLYRLHLGITEFCAYSYFESEVSPWNDSEREKDIYIFLAAFIASFASNINIILKGYLTNSLWKLMRALNSSLPYKFMSCYFVIFIPLLPAPLANVDGTQHWFLHLLHFFKLRLRTIFTKHHLRICTCTRNTYTNVFVRIFDSCCQSIQN